MPFCQFSCTFSLHFLLAHTEIQVHSPPTPSHHHTLVSARLHPIQHGLGLGAILARTLQTVTCISKCPEWHDVAASRSPLLIRSPTWGLRCPHLRVARGIFHTGRDAVADKPLPCMSRSVEAKKATPLTLGCGGPLPDRLGAKLRNEQPTRDILIAELDLAPMQRCNEHQNGTSLLALSQVSLSRGRRDKLSQGLLRVSLTLPQNPVAGDHCGETAWPGSRHACSPVTDATDSGLRSTEFAVGCPPWETQGDHNMHV